MFDILFEDDFSFSDFFNAELWMQDHTVGQPTNDFEFPIPLPHDADTIEPTNGTPIGASLQSTPPQCDEEPASVTACQAEVPVGKSKSSIFTEAEWEEIFDIVFPLYTEKSLACILKALPEKSKFRPSRKQLKTRIKLWHEQARLPRKNIAKDDMDYMVLVAHLRETRGLQTTFMHHGFPVLDQKLSKHKARFGIRYKELNHQNSPPYITWKPGETTCWNLSSGADPPIPQEQQNPAGSQVETLKLIPKSTTESTPMVLDVCHVDNANHDSADGVHRKRKKPTSKDSELSTNYPSPNEWASTVVHSISAKSSSMIRERGPMNSERALTQISVEQLISEVKSIYVGLAMAETKCIQVIQSLAPTYQPEATRKISSDHWKALLALHRVLLHEHHDFLLASQHPNASPALRRLASKYAMPARMWKHGCHEFLELLRRHLPDTLEYMFSFIHGIAYPIYSLLFELVPSFNEVWAENLAHIARYRMATEPEDLRYHDIWAETSRSWYKWVADQSPSEGRLYHHLGVLSRSDPFLQLCYYSRSVTSENIFVLGRSAMLATLEEYSTVGPKEAEKMRNSFCKVHLALISQNLSSGGLSAFPSIISVYSQLLGFFLELDSYLKNKTTLTRKESMNMAVINITALFDYGNQNPLRYIFDVANYLASQPSSQGHKEIELPTSLKDPTFAYLFDVGGYSNKCELVFDTLNALLSLPSTDSRTHSHVLIAMTFLLSLAEASKLAHARFSSSIFDAQLVLERVPWDALCVFLNRTAITTDPVAVPLSFPKSDDPARRPLPEDYTIRGLVWTKHHFPSTWFDVEVEDCERLVEMQSHSESRTIRVAWLARMLCSHGYLSFNNGLYSKPGDFNYRGFDASAWLDIGHTGHTHIPPVTPNNIEQSLCSVSNLSSSRDTWGTSQVADACSTSPSSLNDGSVVDAGNSCGSDRTRICV